MKTRDPGLQAERTRLAWWRTAMTMAVNAMLLVRMGLIGREPVVTACGAGLVILSAVFLAMSAWRSMALASDAQAATPPVMMQAIAGATTMATLLAGASLLSA